MKHKAQVITDLKRGGFSIENIKSYVERPDMSFSVEHNRRVLAETNLENDKREQEVAETVREAAGNIADILASYGVYRLGGSGTKTLDDWLGKEHLKKLYGDRLWSKIGMAQKIKEDNLKKGNTLYGGNFYLPDK